MKTLILNCVNKDNTAEFKESLDVIANDNNGSVIDVNELDIKYCRGCWGCWVKDPGKCIANDETNVLLYKMMNNDLIVFVSDVSMGFVSHQMKKINDKMIPIIHPYMDIVKGEVHHKKRYDKYPKIAVLLISDYIDKIDFNNIKRCYERTALNMRSKLQFFIKDNKELRGLKMKCVIFNGSPRGKNSNSNVIVNWLEEGFSKYLVNMKKLNLDKVSDHFNCASEIQNGDTVIIVFPLYTDSMPGIVKHFFEETESLINNIKNTNFYFVVHSGFPEGNHSRAVEKYLKRYVDILGANYKNTIVMGNSEGLRLMPETINKTRKKCFVRLGENIINGVELDDQCLNKLSSPEVLSKSKETMFRMMNGLKLSNVYWDNQLKKNGVYKKRFAKPFINNK